MAGGERGTGTVPPPNARSNGSTRRPDESMSLMRELVSHALDDGYAAAAARRDPRTRSKRPRLLVLVIALVLLGLLFTVAALQTRRSAPAVAKEKAELVERIDTEASRVDDLRREAGFLQRDVTRLQNDVLSSSSAGQSLRQQLEALDVLAGTSTVTGPGVRITVDDAPTDDPVSGGGGEGRILDIDLQQVVNGLWSAGAEAVAINDQRLTSLTAIRGADQSITVDYRPLARPYVIEAIGNPSTLEANFADSPGGGWLYNLKSMHDIHLETSAVKSMTLPADTGTNLRYAREGSQ